ASPQIHISALKNPAMRGGPFINYDASKVPAIKSLMEKTNKEQVHLIKFAAAIQELNTILDNEADGSSLEPLYKKIPDVLRGYVELGYDLNNNHSIRFIEGLLYKSPYYNESAQSIALSPNIKDDRPFILSTPQIASEGHIYLNVNFRSTALDELFKMKSEPQPLDYITEALNVSAENKDLFSTFFTRKMQPKPDRYIYDKVRVRYFGHAC